MSSIHKYRNTNSFSNHITLLLCGLFILFLLTAIFITKEISFAEGNTTKINTVENDKKILEIKEKIKQTQSEIDKNEIEIKKQQKKSKSLKREILIYNNKINKNELEIKKTKMILEKSKIEIEEGKEKIKEEKEKIVRSKDILKNLIKSLYIYEQDSMLEILMTKDNISDFFNEIDITNSVKDKIFKMIVDLKKEEAGLILKNTDLENQQEDQGKLIQMKMYQNNSLDDIKSQKRELLKISQKGEKQFQKLLTENKNILPSLRAQLYDLQSLGQKIEFDDAFKAAKYIGNITGVRPAYLLGILKEESNLGKNIGSGNYKIDMRFDQRPIFEKITKELGYDPKKMLVSKKPKSYKGWGGAMGPAQMMPRTWISYQNNISKITGHYPPDPWNLVDAIAAMASKVSKVPGVTEGNYEAEYKAAGLYFAGRRWKNYLFYPNNVMSYTSSYKNMLN